TAAETAAETAASPVSLPQRSAKKPYQHARIMLLVAAVSLTGVAFFKTKLTLIPQRYAPEPVIQ
ncbi:MAG: hypothetical protein ABL898_12695, partial [Hyphomicrobiaceae bacterium]